MGRTMQESGNLWGLVLAAGDGRRLQALTTKTDGLAVPKQFCALRSGPSLLSEALQRARKVAAPQRICTIVAEQHRRFWLGHLDSVRADNVIVQPRNRGTAHGILLPLLRILEVDPAARILVLPSDHYVRDEAQLAFALRDRGCGVILSHDGYVLTNAHLGERGLLGHGQLAGW